MLLKRLITLFALLLVGGLLVLPTLASNPEPQDDLAAFKDNSCVTCHSKELKTGILSNKYLDWHLSTHKESGVSCDKCHGGDPTTGNKEKSHQGMLPAKEDLSLVNPVNLPSTCMSCHESISASFIQSKHYEAVKVVGGGGPSCSKCHEHMASTVARTPAEGAALCVQCHSAGSGSPAAKHLDVPARAEEALNAIDRANGIIAWASALMDGAKQRKLDVAAEEKALAAATAQLKEAITQWHTFSLTGVSEKADAAFTSGTKVKDDLRKKMGFN